MSKLMHPKKRNHWTFRNSTGLRFRTIIADTPEEAKKKFKKLVISEGKKWHYYDYSLGYNYLQQDFLKMEQQKKKERENV